MKSPSRWTLVIEVPAVIVTVVMMLHVTANALMRTTLSSPLPHTLEITQYWYMPMIAFLGFVAAQARGQHIATDLLFSRFPSVTQRWVLLAVTVLSIIPCVGFAWFGLGEALTAMEQGRTAGVTTIPSWPTFFLAPLAFAILVVQLARLAVSLVRGTEQLAPVAETDDALLLEELEAEQSTTHDTSGARA